MKIYINNIKVNAISNIGSLNIGKIILCNNRSVSQVTAEPEPEAPPVGITPATQPPGGFAPAPTIPGAVGVSPGQVQVPPVIPVTPNVDIP